MRTVTAAVPKPAQIGLLIGGMAAAVVAGRLMRKRNTGPCERLAGLLLDTALLEAARREVHERPEHAIAACAGYVIHLVVDATSGAGLGRSDAATVGSSFKATHPYTGARAAVFVQRARPDEALVLSLDFDGVCSVRGARNIGPTRLTGMTPARKVQDRLQIDLGDLHTIQIETDLNVADFVATGSNRIQGEMTVDDGLGNGGSLVILPDGEVTGALRNGNTVLGRFAGNAATGVQFLAYHGKSRSRGAGTA